MVSWNQWAWSDETDVDWTNWNGDEPNGYGYEPCAEMFVAGDRAGRWNGI